MMLVLALTVILQGNPEKSEQIRIDRIIRSHNIFSAKTILGPLAELQAESIKTDRQISEFDMFGRNFRDRVIGFGFNPDRVKLDEYYWKSQFPLADAYLADIYFVLQSDHFSHYAVAVRYSEGMFYTTLTLADFEGYH